MKEIEVGKISHYFNNIQVAAMSIDTGELRKGDKVHIKGHTVDFFQEISSMQKDHQEIDVAIAGDDIGFKVEQKVRLGNVVYKVIEE
ncbi:MAG: translation elongation factor-like protein [Candidatus Ratteibacteria bacterium]|jgi:translation elongation factor EF-1alpha